MVKEGVLKKDASVTILHILGTTMILLCHLFQEAGMYALGEIFIIGVPLFLFVAGYLSGKKEITNSLKWIWKKLIRILLPYYLLIAVLFSLYELTKMAEVSLFQWIFCFFNLQGLNYSYWKFEAYGAVDGTGPLWFLTTMMFAYFLTPLFNKFRNVSFKKRYVVLLVLSTLTLQLFAMYIGLQLNYLIVYAIGYFTGAKGVRKDKKYYLIITIGMLILTALRFYFRSVVDGSNFYDRYYAHLSANAIAIWIFYTVFYFETKYPKIYALAQKRWILFLETISFYVYLVHYLFLCTPFAPIQYIDNLIIADIIMLLFTFVTAVLLWWISEKIIMRYICSNKKRRQENLNENIDSNNG